jgi:hypothetical protein
MNVSVVSAQEKKVPKPLKEPDRERLIREVDELPGELPPPPPPAPVKISEEEKENILQFYQQIDPNIEVKVQRLQATDPRGLEKQYQKMYREYMFLKRLQEEETDRYNEAIELRRLSVKADEKARAYHQSETEAQKLQIKTDLREILDKLFDLREKERAAEAERIEKRLEHLRQEMQERRTNKAQIVENRLNQMVGKGYLYEW